MAPNNENGPTPFPQPVFRNAVVTLFPQTDYNALPQTLLVNVTPMSKDFAKKPRKTGPSPRNNATRQKPRQGATPSQRNIPGWLWLFTGTLLGAFFMFLIRLSDVPVDASIEPEATTSAKINQPKSLPKPEFDFYEILKKNEVVVEKGPARRDPNSATLENKEYILQAGSFRNHKDADRLRAQLILLNLEAQVETVKASSGQTWHRVVVGPYVSRSRMAKARGILASNQISPLLLTRKTDGG